MMSPASRQELNKLREIVHFLLAGAGGSHRDPITGAVQCCFCHLFIDDYTEFDKHGNSVGPKLNVQLTIHHVDGNHDNNELENKALSHTRCHKSYHRKLANALRSAKGN